MTLDANIDAGVRRRQGAGEARAPTPARAFPAAKGAGIIVLFLICVVQPFNFTVGDVLLSPLRIFILFAAVPLALAILRGAAGKLIWPDYFLLAYVLWIPIPVVLNHGAAAPLPLTAMTILETLVPYMLARLFIRDAESFRLFGRWVLRLVAVLLPFAAIESIADRNLITLVYDAIPGIDVFRQVEHPPRLGLHRAQGSFEHPILFGVFAVLPLALAWRALFSSAFKRVFWTGISLAAVFFSLSAGALFAAVFQLGLLGYDIIFRSIRTRWRLFATMAVVAYIFGVIFIEANPIVYAISNFTFNSATAFNRVRIWQLGTDVVASSPVFGIAFSDWPRPQWMPPSVDNYWLLIAMRYGMVGFVLFTAAVVASIVRATRLDLSNHPDAALCRSALLISFGGTAIALATVHVWSGTYATLMFLLGAFAWLGFPPRESGGAAAPPSDAGRPGRPARRYTRFETQTGNASSAAPAAPPSPPGGTPRQAVPPQRRSAEALSRYSQKE